MRGTGIALLVAAALLASGCAAGATAAQRSDPVAVVAYRGVQPDPVQDRPEFVLTDTTGHRFDFAEQTRGRPTYLFFGYTHCPDECPTAMADIAAALRQVGPQLRARTRVVFVTTDARRDTGPVLRRWLRQFSAGFIGLTGTQPEVDAAARAAGALVGTVGPSPTVLAGHPDQHVNRTGTAPHQHFGPLGYSVAHSALIYAYDVSDRLPVVYPAGSTPSDLAADLPVLARN